MTRHNIPLGRILGIQIGLDYSWFVIFGLLTWMLAGSYYPSRVQELVTLSVLVHGCDDGHHALCQRAAS